VDGLGVSLGSDDEGGAGIEDGALALETRVFAVDFNTGHGSLPEAILADVINSLKGRSVEFRWVETAESDFTVVLVVSNTGDLVRGDSVLDETLFGKSLDGSESLLFGEGRLCETDETIEGDGVGAEVNSFLVCGAEGMAGQCQASDVNVVLDDGSRNSTSPISDLEW